MKKIFYRVCNLNSFQGLWYAFDGTFTGLIHDQFDFCTNSALKMDFDPELVGWLSATEDLDGLWKWFTMSDIFKLQESGWFIYEYEVVNDRFYERFQHSIIEQSSSVPVRRFILQDLEGNMLKEHV